MARIMARCSRCNELFPVTTMVGTVSAKRGGRVEYMCSNCATRNESYHTTNTKVLGTDKANMVLCGTEFESSYSDEYARNAMFEYGFIPTHDGSLRSDERGRRYGWDGSTCEYVSGLMKGLNRASKFCLTVQTLMDEGHLKVNSSCGTHFHVSIDSMKDRNGNKTYMGYIKRFYHSLFIPLYEEMKANPERTVKVFGRYFNESYAKEIDRYSDVEDRYLFINCKADSNLEFRINKFTSAKQYQNLMKMEVEMVKAIVNNFCEHFMDTEWDRTRYEKRTHYRKHKADVTAKKLVKIYKKYSENI